MSPSYTFIGLPHKVNLYGIVNVQLFYDTFASRKEHIINYWKYRWTNAYTESANNAIKKIEKAGRGYKFEVLRDRCILSINNPAPDKFDYKKATYIKKGGEQTVMKKRETLYELASTLPQGFNELVNSIVLKRPSRMIDYVQRVGRVSRIKTE